METKEQQIILVKTTINAPIDSVWQKWNSPEDITKWYNASEDWHTPKAENDLKVGGKFSYRMEAKDGSFGFDYWGIYDLIIPNKKLVFTLGDNRKVYISFSTMDNKTEIVESFEPENQNPHDMQQAGWQAILDNFKKYIENNI